MHKPRKLVRELAAKRRLEEGAPLRIRNDHGYNDPTPYYALRNIEGATQKAPDSTAKPVR